jgi:sensor histidine kinase YesM
MKPAKKLIEPVIHVIIWLSLYLILILMIKTLGPFKRVDGTILMPVTFGTIINLVLFYSTSLILIPRLSDRKKAGEFLLLISGLLILLTFVESVIDSLLFTVYYSDRSESFSSQLLMNLVFNVIILSLALGYGFTKNWLKNEKLRQSMKQEKLSAELNFLKSQLNPHFLFNVLNMAYSSASGNGDEKTADIIEKLSGLMRYMLYESNVDQIELDKEIEYIRNYINLQRMRFSDDMPVTVNFNIRGDFSSSRIAPLILIQFIENAFKYGVKLEKQSEIAISLSIINRELEFTVKNPIFINPADVSKKTSGIGIENVRKRLEILYPDKHSLKIENSGGYYLVRLLMNLN